MLGNSLVLLSSKMLKVANMATLLLNLVTFQMLLATIIALLLTTYTIITIYYLGEMVVSTWDHRSRTNLAHCFCQ